MLANKNLFLCEQIFYTK